MKAFSDAVLARDMDTVADLLADDVRFISPIAFRPYEGKAVTAAILRGVLRVFTDFAYVRTFHSPDGMDHALVFEAKIDQMLIQGCDFLHVDAQGRIDEFMVMVRPLSAAQLLAAEMAAQFEQIQREVAAES